MELSILLIPEKFSPIFFEFPIPEFALAISNALLGKEADSTPKLKIKFIIIMYINRIILN